MPGYVDTAMNVAHVDDLAAGHLLALERGRQGRSYICGGENITMAQLLRTLSDVTGSATGRIVASLRSSRRSRATSRVSSKATSWDESRGSRWKRRRWRRRR